MVLFGFESLLFKITFNETVNIAVGIILEKEKKS